MNTSRRNFVLAAGACLSVPLLRNSIVNGKDTPSKKITMGFIGVGSHGTGVNLPNFLSIPEVRVISVCDAIIERSLKAKQKVDTAYGNTDCRIVPDFRQILEDRSIDAVCISTPEHWHVTMATMALQAGKDVFCEKPTKYISEGFALQECFNKHKAVFQTGLEDRSCSRFHKIVEWCRNGALGDVEKVDILVPRFKTLPPPKKDVPVPEGLDYNLFSGPSPLVPFQTEYIQPMAWRTVRNFGAGSLLDWGAHLFDTAQLCVNAPEILPTEISGQGLIPTNSITDVPVEFDVDVTYSNGVNVNIKHGGCSIKVYGSKGWIHQSGWDGPLTASDISILRNKYELGTSKYQQMPKSEHVNFIECVKSREKTTYPVDSMHSIHLGLHAADISIRLGRKVKWDSKANQFIGDLEANKLATAPEPRSWQNA